ncbi:MAG: hypothetical protein J6D53_14105 [Blautia sp.]|nr:hypothetical protein [Blautia sp.]
MSVFVFVIKPDRILEIAIRIVIPHFQQSLIHCLIISNCRIQIHRYQLFR